MWIVTIVELDYDSVDDLVHYTFDTKEEAENCQKELAQVYHHTYVQKVDDRHHGKYPRPLKVYVATIDFMDWDRITYSDITVRNEDSIPADKGIYLYDSGVLMVAYVTAYSIIGREDALMKAACLIDEQEYKPDDFTYISGGFRRYVLKDKIVDGYLYLNGRNRVNVGTGETENLVAVDKKGNRIAYSGDPNYHTDIWFGYSGGPCSG